jgi:hypothetical protein
MVVHILCPECSEDLAEIYPLYNMIKIKYCTQLLKDSDNYIDIDKIDLKNDIFVKFEFILEALRINNMCCRIHILGNTEFDSLYE